MMPKKSMIFMLGLVFLVVFLGGFRLGKLVERADKSFVPPPTITPLPSATPIPQSPKFTVFSHKGCGVEFLNATNLMVTKNSSDEAVLQNDTERVYLSCTSAKQKLAAVTDREATESVKIQNQTVNVFKRKENYYFTILNPKNAKTVYFEVTNGLKDLLLKTL